MYETNPHFNKNEQNTRLTYVKGHKPCFVNSECMIRLPSTDSAVEVAV